MRTGVLILAATVLTVVAVLVPELRWVAAGVNATLIVGGLVVVARILGRDARLRGGIEVHFATPSHQHRPNQIGTSTQAIDDSQATQDANDVSITPDDGRYDVEDRAEPSRSSDQAGAIAAGRDSLADCTRYPVTHEGPALRISTGLTRAVQDDSWCMGDTKAAKVSQGKVIRRERALAHFTPHIPPPQHDPPVCLPLEEDRSASLQARRRRRAALANGREDQVPGIRVQGRSWPSRSKNRSTSSESTNPESSKPQQP